MGINTEKEIETELGELKDQIDGLDNLWEDPERLDKLASIRASQLIALANIRTQRYGLWVTIFIGLASAAVGLGSAIPDREMRKLEMQKLELEIQQLS